MSNFSGMGRVGEKTVLVEFRGKKAWVFDVAVR
jgi:hypothetical protein